MEISKAKEGKSIFLRAFRVIVLTVVFGIAFAFVEATVVIYLRKLLGIDGGYELPVPTKQDIIIALPYFVVLKSLWGKTIIPQVNIFLP